MGVEGFKVVLSALDLKVDNVFCRFGTVAGAAGYDEIMQIVFTAVRFWMDMITIGRLRQLLREVAPAVTVIAIVVKLVKQANRMQ